MRNQYKVLEEKYDQLVLKENEPAFSVVNDPVFTKEFVERTLQCDTYEKFRSVIKEYILKYPEIKKAVRPAAHHHSWLDFFTTVKIINDLGIEDIIFEYYLRAVEDTAYNVLLEIEKNPSFIIWTASKRTALKAWNAWWAAYGPYMDAKKKIEQQNKETGINLDI